MTAPLTPEQIAELKELVAARKDAGRVYSARDFDDEWSAPFARVLAALVNAAPALLDAAERVAELEAALARARSRKACECDCGYCEQGHIYEGLDGNGNPLAAEEGNTRHDAGEGKK